MLGKEIGMDEKMTRKGFLAAAAAAGVAALVPTAASAAEEEGTGAETALLDELGVEVEHGAEALADSEWAELAASQTDVYKSHSGMHIMNAPGYFAFSGWDAARDQPTDLGFVFASGGMAVKAREMNVNGAPVLGRRKLWSGSLKLNSSANVPGISDYMLFAVKTEGPACVGVKPGEYLDFTGGSTTHQGGTLQITGTTAKYILASSGVGNVTEIWGLA